MATHDDYLDRSAVGSNMPASMVLFSSVKGIYLFLHQGGLKVSGGSRT